MPFFGSPNLEKCRLTPWKISMPRPIFKNVLNSCKEKCDWCELSLVPCVCNGLEDSHWNWNYHSYFYGCTPSVLDRSMHRRRDSEFSAHLVPFDRVAMVLKTCVRGILSSQHLDNSDLLVTHQKMSDLTFCSVSNSVALSTINANVRNFSELRINLNSGLLPLWMKISMICKHDKYEQQYLWQISQNRTYHGQFAACKYFGNFIICQKDRHSTYSGRYG